MPSCALFTLDSGRCRHTQEDRRRDCRYHLTETLPNFLISVVSVIRGKFGFLCNGGTSQNLCLLRAPTGTLNPTVCLKRWSATSRAAAGCWTLAPPIPPNAALLI